MPTYYKVVRTYNKKLYSGNLFPDKSDYWYNNSIRYVINKWTYPKKKCNQFLFVFDNLADAKDWTEITGKIYECEIGKIIQVVRGISQFNVTFNEINLGYVPRGTILTDKVKIIRKVK